MKKTTITATPFGAALRLEDEAMEAAKFMVRHPSALLGEDVFNSIKSSVKMTVSSAFAEIYSKVVENSGWKSSFTLLDLSNPEESIPTIFTLDDITIDGKYIRNQQLPKTLHNAWINLTPILGKRNTLGGSYNGVTIKDTPRLAALISRAVLCMSYNDADVWLTSYDSAILLDAFTFTMTFPIKQLFNLDVEEEKLVKTLFAVYFAQLLHGTNDNLDIPPILNRCTWLGTPREIMARLDSVAEDRAALCNIHKLEPGQMTLETTCQLIAMHGPDRMKGFSSATLVRYMSRSAMERNSTIMAMYYPPYFVYMLLAAMHGLKHPIYSLLLKFGDMKKNLVKLESDIIHSSTVVGVNR